MAQIEAASGEVTVQIYAQQEGAYVQISLEDGPTPTRLDAYLTPDQAESLATALNSLAPDARKYGTEQAL